MRLPQFRLRTLMFGIAILSLILTVIVQSVLLRNAAIREQQLRAALAQAEAEKEWASAINNWNRFGGSEPTQKKWAAAMNYRKWVRASTPPADPKQQVEPDSPQ
jgi:hypothetical protein